jgi:hypothetical protein
VRGVAVSGDSERLTMTKAEFRAYVNESFDNGAAAALESMERVIAALRLEVTAANLSTAADPDG